MRQKTLIAFLLMVTIGLVIISCSDDDDTAVGPSTVAIVGSWQVIDGSQATYMIFGSDNVVHFLYEYDLGFRDKMSAIYVASEDQLVLEGMGFLVYNYTVDHDTLRLTTPDQGPVLVYDANAPTVDEWVTPITPQVEYEAPIAEALDMAWGGDRLWYANANGSDYIYRLNPVSGAIEDSVDIPYRAWTLVWAGSDLWVSHGSYTTIRQYDTLTGTTPQYGPTTGNWIKGLAWDGQYLWIGSDGSRTIYQYDPAADSLLDSIVVDRSIDGMTWADGFLYVCSDGIINVLQPSSATVTAAYEIPGRQVRGIAFDGTSFWVSSTDWTNVMIARLSL